jgi:hypothetical protein
MVQAAKTTGKGPILLKTLNRKTGRESNVKITFNEGNWGEITNSYMDLIRKNLHSKSFEKIITEAHNIAQASCGNKSSSNTTDTRISMEIDGSSHHTHYAQLIDISDSESDD